MEEDLDYWDLTPDSMSPSPVGVDGESPSIQDVTRLLAAGGVPLLPLGDPRLSQRPRRASERPRVRNLEKGMGADDISMSSAKGKQQDFLAFVDRLERGMQEMQVAAPAARRQQATPKAPTPRPAAMARSIRGVADAGSFDDDLEEEDDPPIIRRGVTSLGAPSRHEFRRSSF